MVTARTVNTPCQGADNVRVAGYLMTGPWAQLGKQVCRYQVPRPTAPDALHDDQMMSRTETLSSPLTPMGSLCGSTRREGGKVHRHHGELRRTPRTRPAPVPMGPVTTTAVASQRDTLSHWRRSASYISMPIRHERQQRR